MLSPNELRYGLLLPILAAFATSCSSSDSNGSGSGAGGAGGFGGSPSSSNATSSSTVASSSVTSSSATASSTGSTGGGGTGGAANGGGGTGGLANGGAGGGGVGGSGAAPPGWTCSPNLYGDASCDCGCGVVDSDCADATGASCEYCDDSGSCSTLGCLGTIEPTNNAVCLAPETCDNGIDDNGNGRIDCADPTCFGNALCPVPAAWTCDPTFYGDSTCDCGCGVVDVDCADATSASCQFCKNSGSCGTLSCPGNIEPTNNAVCLAPENCNNGIDDNGNGKIDCADPTCFGNALCPVPAAWACTQSFYGDGLCDCGCGVMDVDCADATVASCDYCDDNGSCSTDVGCPGMINPTNNTVCN